MNRGTRTGATVVLLLASGVARADLIAAVPPRISGTSETSATLATSFRESLEGGLTTTGHEVVRDAKLDALLRLNPTLAACDTDVCFQRLGQLVSARAVMRTVVEILGSSNYQIRMELHDVTQPHVVAIVEDACTVCTVREANDAISRAAAEVGRRFHGTVEGPLRPPMVEREPQASTAATIAARPPTEPRSSRSKLFLGLGVTALVLGAGSVGAGAYLVATDGSHGDGSTSVNPKTTAIEYDYTRQSLVGGVVLTVAGAALLAGGAVLLWRSHVENQRAHR